MTVVLIAKGTSYIEGSGPEVDDRIGSRYVICINDSHAWIAK